MEGERERETSMVGSARIGSHVNECSLTCVCVCVGGGGYTYSLTIVVRLWLFLPCVSLFFSPSNSHSLLQLARSLARSPPSFLPSLPPSRTHHSTAAARVLSTCEEPGHVCRTLLGCTRRYHRNVCMYVCMYIRMYVYVYMCMYICLYVYVCLRMYVCI